MHPYQTSLAIIRAETDRTMKRQEGLRNMLLHSGVLCLGEKVQCQLKMVGDCMQCKGGTDIFQYTRHINVKSNIPTTLQLDSQSQMTEKYLIFQAYVWLVINDQFVYIIVSLFYNNSIRVYESRQFNVHISSSDQIEDDITGLPCFQQQHGNLSIRPLICKDPIPIQFDSDYHLMLSHIKWTFL